MRGRRGGLFGWAACMLMAAGLGFAEPAAAQDEQASPVLVVDMVRIRTETSAGKDMLAKIKQLRESIAADLSERGANLRKEEQRLAEERPNLLPEEFRDRVRAFEQQVFTNREFSERSNRRLQLLRATGSKMLRERVTGVLAKIMVAREAEVLLDATQIVLSVDRLDITDEAIARLDEIFPEMTLDVTEIQQ